MTKWFRGEYLTKSEARAELGVGAIITDDDWYDYIKLFARFLRGAGYEGLVVLADELVNLWNHQNTIRAMNACYESVSLNAPVNL